MNHYFLTAILYRNLSAFDIERNTNDTCMTFLAATIVDCWLHNK